MNIPTNQGVFPKMGHRVHETPSGSARSASNGIGVSLLGPPGVAQMMSPASPQAGSRRYSIRAMSWSTIELEPEVEGWLLSLTDDDFGQVER
jgi:hypothetical protein